MDDSPFIFCCLMVIITQVRDQGKQKGEVSPFIDELKRLEEQAKEKGLGLWCQVSLLPFSFSNLLFSPSFKY